MMITWCCARLFVEFNWDFSLLLQEIWSSRVSVNFIKMTKINETMLSKDMQILLSRNEITTSRRVVSWSWCLKNTSATSVMMIAWVKDAEASRMKRNWDLLQRLSVIFEELLFKSTSFFFDRMNYHLCNRVKC